MIDIILWIIIILSAYQLIALCLPEGSLGYLHIHRDPSGKWHIWWKKP